MKIGLLGLDDDSKAFQKRLGSDREPEQDTTAYYANLARLGLLSFMLLFAIIGGILSSRSEKPENLIRRSITKSLDRSFHASLEGKSSLRDSTISTYRNHQQYTPETGVTVVQDKRANDKAPFDALSALQSIALSKNSIELEREDMFNHGTRRFSGSFVLPGDEESSAHVFEYWIDMRSLLAVRINIASVKRSFSVATDGEPITKETFIVLRFYEWE